MQRPTRTGHAGHGTLGHGVARLLRNRLMVRGIEGLAQGVEFGEALLGQGVPQLVDRHAEAFGDRAAFGLALGGGEPEGERIEAR